MLDSIDALVALANFGTVSEAATRLRLTQSAVSKRLQSLQATVGYRLLEPEGRRLRLTAQAIEFLAHARPLVAELRGLLQKPATGDTAISFSLALADSIASSWGPAVIQKAVRAQPGSRVDLHAHRSILVIESVRLGRYDIGLCTESPGAKDLVAHPLVEEPMVLVHAELARRPAPGAPLITIEPTSATWRAIHPQLRAHHAELLTAPQVFVESFGAVAQMARAGFGNGLLPLGLALDLKLERTCYRILPKVARRVSLLTRKTVHELPSFLALRVQLELATRSHLEWLRPAAPAATGPALRRRRTGSKRS
jgi:DNA-binding transcriptional LysR family regulator